MTEKPRLQLDFVQPVEDRARFFSDAKMWGLNQEALGNLRCLLDEAAGRGREGVDLYFFAERDQRSWIQAGNAWFSTEDRNDASAHDVVVIVALSAAEQL